MTKSKSTRARTSPAVQAARERASSPDGTVVLSTGYRAKLRPVAASLIADVTTRIEDPVVPMWMNPDKEREEPNPNDPKYVAELARTERERARATIDTIVMFGVELIDPPTGEQEWVRKLRFLEKQGHLSLDGYDLDDGFDREFLFKRYIAVSAADLNEVMRASGVTQEAIERASASFPSA